MTPSVEHSSPRRAKSRIAVILGGLMVLGAGVIAGPDLLWRAMHCAASEPPSLPARRLAADVSTPVQVRCVGNVEKQRFDWGWIAWLACADLDAEAKTTLGLVHIDPARSNPVHKHRTCEEVIYVLSGQCEHHVGDRWVTLRAGDALRIPAGTVHSARTTADHSLEAIVVYNTGRRDFEEVRP